MIAPSFLIFIGIFFKIIEAYNRPNHFGNPCVVCKCFVQYKDRDMPISFKPYGVAYDGYSSTEDQCLVTCLNDRRCKAVVYGLIGGRDVFTCELYEETTMHHLIYTPNVNIYLPKRKSDCKVFYDHVENLVISEPQEEISKRKRNYLTLFTQSNPFAFG
ncbi:Hemocytin [Dirofilaria immitis]